MTATIIYTGRLTRPSREWPAPPAQRAVGKQQHCQHRPCLASERQVHRRAIRFQMRPAEKADPQCHVVASVDGWAR